MLQVYVSNVQLFQMYIANVLFGCCICCSAHTHILQACAVNVSSISDAHTHILQACAVNISSILYVCCSKCFMLKVFHEQAWQGGVGEGGPRGHGA
jgi:hypothetical protein